MLSPKIEDFLREERHFCPAVERDAGWLCPHRPGSAGQPHAGCERTGIQNWCQQSMNAAIALHQSWLGEKFLLDLLGYRGKTFLEGKAGNIAIASFYKQPGEELQASVLLPHSQGLE